MRILSLKNKFLAALLGIGLVEALDWESTSNSRVGPLQRNETPLEKGWLAQLEASLIQLPSIEEWPEPKMPSAANGSEAAFIYGVPALLRWHDHAHQRQAWISSRSWPLEIQDELWFLGNILEYLLAISQARPSLGQPFAAYLTQQCQGDWPHHPVLIASLIDTIERSSGPAVDLGNDADQASQQADPLPLAVALQSFLTVPESYGLAVNNALRRYGILPAMLTGFMVGAYGGIEVLPVEWLLLTKFKRIQQLSDRLFAQWAGQGMSVIKDQLSLSSQMVSALTL